MGGDELQAALNRAAVLFGKHGEEEWRDRLAGLAARLGDEPLACAVEILGLYAGRGSFEEAAPRKGYAEPGPEREQAFEYARLRWDIYQQALALWHAHRQRGPAGIEGDGRLLDYGGGQEVHRRGDRHFARYDAGAHFQVWREDEISADEATQAALGPTHFSRMIVALQNRLQAQGSDPYKSNFTWPDT